MWFVGDDWAEEHHDVEVQDESGRRLGRARLPEGSEGVARLHALIAGAVGSDAEPDQVLVGVETDRGGRGWRRWSRPVTGCSRLIRGRWPALGSGTAPREPRVMPVMRTRWPTWCAPTPTSCARSPGTARWSKASR